MPVLIDGNNLLHRLPAARASRTEARRLVLEACRRQRMRVTLVFDGPPPQGTPQSEPLGALTVHYSGPETADDLIVRTLPSGGRARGWVVVTDDRGLAARARQHGAEVRAVGEWLGRMRSQPLPRPRTEPKLSSREVSDWQDYFSRGDGEQTD